MTKAQLLGYAEENGIGGLSARSTKATMIETIEAAL